MIERILKLLEEKGISAYKFTSDLKLSSGAVSDWKKGRSKPGADAIIKIADYFGVTTDYLLTGKKNNAHHAAGLAEVNVWEGVSMTREIRKILKGLQPWFKLLREPEKCSVQTIGIMDEENNAIREEYILLLSRIGVSLESIDLWSVGNFDTPPTIEQLKALVDFCDSNYVFIPNENGSVGYEFDLIKETIEDYKFELSQESIRVNYVSKTDYDNFKGEVVAALQNLQAEVAAISESTDELEKSAIMQRYQGAIGVMASRIMKRVA